MSRPLEGYRVIELAGIGPGPYAGQLLADLGAEVINVERPSQALVAGAGTRNIDRRGKKSIVLDLRKRGAAEILLKLVATADVLIEGNRPGVTERLGVGPKACHKVNPKLVYGRMTGWGQTGPWAKMAGHDINYISITGALAAMGRKDNPPPPPLNLVGDYGGGTMVLIMGVLAALLRAEKTGKGDVVDAAIIDGVSSMMGIVYSMNALGFWQNKRQANLLDGAAPFYRCYETQDGRFMAVGCIEPQFFTIMLDKLGLDKEEFGGQMNPKNWPQQHKQLEASFAVKTMAQWSEIFDGSDACVTPVLDYEEATSHKQNAARGGLKSIDGLTHPRPIPAFAQSPQEPRFDISGKAQDTMKILKNAGYSATEIAAFAEQEIIGLGD